MNDLNIEVRELIGKAREALRRGDKGTARELGERAIRLAPQLEDAWLILAASDPNPQNALAHARKAQQIDPHSGRAQRAVEWASRRLHGTATPAVAAQTVPPPVQKHAYQTAVAMPALKPQGRNWLFPVLLAGAACMLLALFAGFALIGPATATFINTYTSRSQENLWAPVDIAKPGAQPVDAAPLVAQEEATPTATPSQASQSEPTVTSTEEPVPQPSATETPGSIAMEILEDTPTSEVIPAAPELSLGEGVRWIDVDLTNQMLYAYEGDTIVNSFVVSTGTWLTPTVIGTFKIYVKVRMQDMRGPGYHLRDVPYVMFFHGDYGLHGTYWHNNFGTPMSRGCVNLRIEDAAWLYDWASVGTVVNVHY
jgi:lipoprotein-anchoring transpeptidase ErfK/SrfK